MDARSGVRPADRNEDSNRPVAWATLEGQPVPPKSTEARRDSERLSTPGRWTRGVGIPGAFTPVGSPYRP